VEEFSTSNVYKSSWTFSIRVLLLLLSSGWVSSSKCLTWLELGSAWTELEPGLSSVTPVLGLILYGKMLSK